MWEDLNLDSIRIDILDETEEEIKNMMKESCCLKEIV